MDLSCWIPGLVSDNGKEKVEKSYFLKIRNKGWNKERWILPRDFSPGEKSNERVVLWHGGAVTGAFLQQMFLETAQTKITPNIDNRLCTWHLLVPTRVPFTGHSSTDPKPHALSTMWHSQPSIETKRPQIHSAWKEVDLCNAFSQMTLAVSLLSPLSQDSHLWAWDTDGRIPVTLRPPAGEAAWRPSRGRGRERCRRGPSRFGPCFWPAPCPSGCRAMSLHGILAEPCPIVDLSGKHVS